MTAEKAIRELEQNRRKSARAIPFYVCFLVVAAGALWVLGQFFTISIWITIIVLGITAFTLVGDIYIYFYCGRKLRTLKQSCDGARDGGTVWELNEPVETLR